MLTTLEETSEVSAALSSGAAKSRAETAEPTRDAQWYVDQDPALYPEAVAHLLRPRRRTVVTPETLAAIRAACDKH